MDIPGATSIQPRLLSLSLSFTIAQKSTTGGTEIEGATDASGTQGADNVVDSDFEEVD